MLLLILLCFGVATFISALYFHYQTPLQKAQGFVNGRLAATVF